MKKLTFYLFSLLIFPLSLSAHSVGGYFVSDGSSCYLVFPNWHGSESSQTSAIGANDGIFFDLNRDGSYESVGPVGMGPYAPLGANNSEFYMFTDYMDITDLDYTVAGTYTTWEGEIETWFTTNVGPGFDASLVWDVSQTCNSEVGYWALILQMDSCPTVSDVYDASVADGTATSEPCDSSGDFLVDFTAVDLQPIPTMGQWGIIILGLMMTIASVVAFGIGRVRIS